MTSPKIISLLITIILFLIIIFSELLIGLMITGQPKIDSGFLIKYVFPFPIVYFLILLYIKNYFELPVKNITNKFLKKIDSNYNSLLSTDTEILDNLLNTFELFYSENQKLKKTGNQYKRLVESLERDYFLYSHNTDGIFTYISPSIKTILGYEPEEFMTDYDKFYTDNPINKKASEYTLKSIQGIKQHPYKLELLNKYGNTCLMEVSEIPVRDENNKVIAVEGIARDISKEELTLNALKNSEERFKSIFHNSPISIWEEDFSEVKKYLNSLNLPKDTNKKIYLTENPEVVKKCANLVKVMDINNATLKLLKAKTKSELYTNISRTFTKESYNAFAEELFALWNGNSEIKTDGTIKTLDGDEREVRVKCSIPKSYEKSWEKILVTMFDITDRKLIEQKLLEKDYIINSAGSYISTCDLDGIMNYVNPAFLAKWGFNSVDEIYGKPFWDFWMVEDNMEFIMNSLKGIGKWSGELMGKKNNGSLFYVQVSASTVRNEDGKPICLMSTSVDITDRKEAEYRLKVATELGIDLIYEWDIETDNLLWFGDIDSALGYEKGTVPNSIEGWIKLIHPFDLEKLSGAVEEHRTSTKDIYYIYRVLHNDGSWRYWHDHGVPMLDENNKPYKWIGICSDITDKKINEQNLLEKENIIEFCSNIVMLTDVNGFIKYANPVFFKKLNINERSNIYNRPFWKFISTEEKPENILEQIKTTDNWKGEFFIKSNYDIKFQFKSKSVKDEDNKIISLIFISI